MKTMQNLGGKSMKPSTRGLRQQEIELKLALPTTDPSSLSKRLSRLPLLARRTPVHQNLHNVYYDTPQQILRHKRIALRIRRVGSDASPQWLQTLKTGNRDDSALSRRGEWEAPVPSDTLVLNVLQATPWATIDPDGTVFQALAPTFSTTFERTSWTVRRRDGSVIEVALDIGVIVAGDKRAPICELELELLAGQPAALFHLARQIAATIAVLPANVSKAERGYALAGEGPDMPLRAQPPKLAKQLLVSAAAGRVLREIFCHFTTNLNALHSSDDPEVVHQARVGWRRLKSALRLFKPALAVNAAPSWQALQPMLSFLGELRDIDVARAETLPLLEDVYVAGNAQRAESWRAMTQSLLQEAKLQRKSVRYALEDPAVGATLLAATQWLEELSAIDGVEGAGADVKVPLPRWSKRRLDRLHHKLKIARNDADNPESLHRVRILAKRLRYGIDALRTFLPKRRANRWYRQATNLQRDLGVNRDGMQAGALLAKLDADRGLIEFVRGVAIGKARQG